MCCTNDEPELGWQKLRSECWYPFVSPPPVVPLPEVPGRLGLVAVVTTSGAAVIDIDAVLWPYSYIAVL